MLSCSRHYEAIMSKPNTCQSKLRSAYHIFISSGTDRPARSPLTAWLYRATSKTHRPAQWTTTLALTDMSLLGTRSSDVVDIKGKMYPLDLASVNLATFQDGSFF